MVLESTQAPDLRFAFCEIAVANGPMLWRNRGLQASSFSTAIHSSAMAARGFVCSRGREHAISWPLLIKGAGEH